MALAPASLQNLPIELKDRILDFCDWPSLVNIICVSKLLYCLGHPRVANSEARRKFLYAYERSEENADWASLSIDADAFRALRPEQQYRHPKKLYVCSVCEKLKRARAFAKGQLRGGMGKKRFCLECGTDGVPAKYVPGSTVIVFSDALRWRDATLCRQCKLWCHGEFCMKEKLCSQCVVHRSRRIDSKDSDRPESRFKLAPPLYCTSCGGKWFFSRPAYYRKLQGAQPPVQRPYTTLIMQLLVSQSERD